MKRESEKIALEGTDKGTPVVLPPSQACYVKNETHASYLTHCSEQPLPSLSAAAPVSDSADASASAGAKTGSSEL